MPLNISIQWNAGTACVSEWRAKNAIACRGLRVGPSTNRSLVSGVAPPNRTKESQFMNFSRGHSGTKVRDVNRSCFPKENTPEFTQKNGQNSYELFVLPLSLWFFLCRGRCPDSSFGNGCKGPLSTLIGEVLQQGGNQAQQAETQQQPAPTAGRASSQARGAVDIVPFGAYYAQHLRLCPEELSFLVLPFVSKCLPWEVLKSAGSIHHVM